MLLYELATGGSVPYASFSNAEVKAKVSVHVTPVCLNSAGGVMVFPSLLQSNRQGSAIDGD